MNNYKAIYQKARKYNYIVFFNLRIVAWFALALPNNLPYEKIKKCIYGKEREQVSRLGLL